MSFSATAKRFFAALMVFMIGSGPIVYGSPVAAESDPNSVKAQPAPLPPDLRRFAVDGPSGEKGQAVGRLRCKDGRCTYFLTWVDLGEKSFDPRLEAQDLAFHTIPLGRFVEVAPSVDRIELTRLAVPAGSRERKVAIAVEITGDTELSGTISCPFDQSNPSRTFSTKANDPITMAFVEKLNNTSTACLLKLDQFSQPSGTDFLLFSGPCGEQKIPADGLRFNIGYPCSNFAIRRSVPDSLTLQLRSPLGEIASGSVTCATASGPSRTAFNLGPEQTIDLRRARAACSIAIDESGSRAVINGIAYDLSYTVFLSCGEARLFVDPIPSPGVSVDFSRRCPDQSLGSWTLEVQGRENPDVPFIRTINYDLTGSGAASLTIVCPSARSTVRSVFSMRGSGAAKLRLKEKPTGPCQVAIRNARRGVRYALSFDCGDIKALTSKAVSFDFRPACSGDWSLTWEQGEPAPKTTSPATRPKTTIGGGAAAQKLRTPITGPQGVEAFAIVTDPQCSNYNFDFVHDGGFTRCVYVLSDLEIDGTTGPISSTFEGYELVVSRLHLGICCDVVSKSPIERLALPTTQKVFVGGGTDDVIQVRKIGAHE